MNLSVGFNWRNFFGEILVRLRSPGRKGRQAILGCDDFVGETGRLAAGY